jgi:feruloyl esterase
MKLLHATAAAALSGAALAASSRRNQTRSCSAEAIQALLPSNAVVEAVEKVTAGAEYGEGAGDVAYPTNPTDLPALCAVTVNVTSSSTSAYRFGLFLPDEWNSRFLAVGNGGFSGGINWLDIGAGVQYGFAAMSTDTGHNSTVADISWALNLPEKKTDFGYRAMQGSVDLAKNITQAYYGQDLSYSYYSGCSTGGRQGLKEAQVSPDHFDGLLVGAPAWYTAHLQTWTIKVATYNLPTSDPKHIPASLFSVLAAEVLKQCDAVDGVRDGIVSKPDSCSFNSTVLSCDLPGANTTACLTALQLDTLANIYGDYYAEGLFAFPSLLLSSEAQWSVLLSGDEPNGLGAEYPGNWLFNDASWNWTSYNDSIVRIADELDPGHPTANDYDMSPLQNNGGKIIMYHGMADGLIPTYSSKVFYERAAAAMGGADSLDSWFRFFLVPGMHHCDGTSADAPWYFAGGNQAGSLNSSLHSTPGYSDAQHDALLALMDWVEKDVPVDTIIATTWYNASDPESGVLRQRPLCPYPTEATWDGVGDADLATSWSCQ